jgi:pyruvate dehydrogenase E2 component (dihydrolipoamide acetyltransferase)
VVASPYARKLARDAGADLTTFSGVGTGPNGRIIASDVEAWLEAGASPAPLASEAGVEGVAPADVAVTGVAGDSSAVSVSEAQAALADLFVYSKRAVPHYYLTMDISLNETLKLRRTLNEGREEEDQLSLQTFMLKAAALASRSVPEVNSQWHGDVIRHYDAVDINVAVNVGGSVVAPVLRGVEGLGLAAIQSATNSIAEAAADDSFTSDGLAPGTLSIANLGAFGVSSHSPIIRPPQACALGLGAAEARVVPNMDAETMGERPYDQAIMMTATLSCDHRIVDGAVGSEWLGAFKALLEDPMKMLL